jgi:hypothetical protein
VPAPIPSQADTIEMYVGTWGAGRAISGSHTIDLLDFPTLPGQSAPVQLTAADVGCPIMIVGGGAVDPLTPVIFQVQGGTLHSVITAVHSPTSCDIADAVVTSYYNSGFRNIAVFRSCGMLVDSWDWRSLITQSTRDSFAFTALQTDPYFDRNQVMLLGQPIYLRSTEYGDIFGGLIDSLDVTNQPQPTSGGLVPPVNPAGTQPFAYVANCTSWDSIPSRRRVQAQFATTYTDTADVVMRKVCLVNMSDEGVSVSGPVGPVITVDVPAGAVVQDVMDACATAATQASGEGWYHKFDEWRNCVFAPATEVPAPWDVDDVSGSDDNVLAAVTKSTSHDQLYNTVYGLGSKVLLGSITTVFTGPATQPFQCPTALQTPPTITLNGNPQTVGIAGVDTGMDWYWSQDSAAVSGSNLVGGDELIIISQPSVAALAVAYNNAGLQGRALVEGPGASYEQSIQVTTVTDPAGLFSQTQQVATQNGIPPVSVAATTVRGGLTTGMLQHIRLADVAVDDDFLITEVKLSSTDNLLCWQYTALTGYAVPTWLTAFTQFINRGKTTLANLSTTSVPITGPAMPSPGNYASGPAGISSTPPLPFPGNVNIGDLLVVVATRNSLTAPTVTDSLGNTYTLAVGGNNPGPFANGAAILYAISAFSGTCTVTCLQANFISIAAISGIDPASPLDATASHSGSAPSITTGHDNNIVITGMCMDSGSSVPTATAPEIVFGYTLGGGPASDNAAALEVKATAGSFTSTLANAAGNPFYVSASFNRAPATSPPAPDTETVGNAMGTVTHSTGALTANLPVLGNGGGDVKVGVVGQLVPAGGSAHYVLTKNSGTDYDDAWLPVSPATHSEPLTDGHSNFIFAAGDIIVVVGVPN